MTGQASTRSPTRPWNPNSLFWIAFFGGPLAITIIAWMNARRLGLSRQLNTIVILGGVGVAVGVLAFCIFVHYEIPRWVDRPFNFLVAIALFFTFRRLQASAANAWANSPNANFASVWVPGIVVIVVGAVLATVLKVWVLGIVDPEA